MKQVLKGGGSILRTPADVLAFVNLVKRGDYPYIVVSAPGRTATLPKLTDSLMSEAGVGTGVRAGPPALDRMRDLATDLAIDPELIALMAEDFDQARARANRGKSADLVSRGEYWMAKIIAALLGERYLFVDAARFLRSDGTNSISIEQSQRLLRSTEVGLKRIPRMVVPGYYVGCDAGEITLLPRDGSNITAVAVAALFSCPEVVNISDVSGIHVVNPRVLDGTVTVPIVTFDELRELSMRGLARVLQNESVLLARTHGIRIHVASHRSLPTGGTRVVPSEQLHTGAAPHAVTGIAIDTGYTVITIERDNWAPYGDMARLAACFKHSCLNIELDTAVRASVSYATVASPDALAGVTDEIKRLWPNARVTTEDEQAILYVVGRGMRSDGSVQGRVLSAIGRVGAPIKMIAQPGTRVSLCMVVPTGAARACVREIYQEFFGT